MTPKAPLFKERERMLLELEENARALNLLKQKIQEIGESL